MRLQQWSEWYSTCWHIPRMRKPLFALTALFVPALLSAQTFPSIADVSKPITILEKGMDVKAIAVDPTGNVYLAGTSTLGFAAATSRIGPLGDVDFFVIKTNAAADQILYAAAIGGTGTESLRAMQVDTSGNVYLLGSTVSRDLPLTSQVNQLVAIGAVALKLNATGTALTYSAQLGSTMTPLAMDVDSTGAAYISGSANAADIATTAGVLKPAPGAGANPGDYMGFVVKLAPNGNSYQAATYFGAPNKTVEAVSVRSNGVLIIADGSLVLLNTGLSQQVSTTTINMTSAQMAFDSTGNIHLAGISTGVAGGFVMKKYAATGQTLLLDKTYPFTTANTVPRIAVTAAGRIYLFGEPNSLKFTLNASQPCMANIAAPNGIAGLPAIDTSGGLIGTTGQPIPPDQGIIVLDPTGNVLHATFTTALVSYAAVAPGNGRVYTSASETLFTSPTWTKWNGVIRFNQDLIPPVSLAPACLVHGASFAPKPLSPGGLATFFGNGMGPDAFTSFTLPGGIVEQALGGVSVTVDGKPAPMLFSWDKQINFIVPWTTRTDGRAVPVCLSFGGKNTCVQASTATAVPASLATCNFQTEFSTCALNQDNTIHQKTNPAAPGSVVQLFMTGFGIVDGTLTEGGVATGALRNVKGTVTASTEPPPVGGCGLFNCAVSGGPKNVVVGFAGAAPNLILGANQVNILIPADMPSGLQTFTISFKPAGATDAVTTNVPLWIR
jgi:uncharacterized protein (TIGR03437 family)